MTYIRKHGLTRDDLYSHLIMSRCICVKSYGDNMPISYHLQDIAQYLSKIAKFSIPRVNHCIDL